MKARLIHATFASIALHLMSGVSHAQVLDCQAIDAGLRLQYAAQHRDAEGIQNLAWRLSHLTQSLISSFSRRDRGLLISLLTSPPGERALELRMQIENELPRSLAPAIARLTGSEVDCRYFPDTGRDAESYRADSRCLTESVNRNTECGQRRSSDPAEGPSSCALPDNQSVRRDPPLRNGNPERISTLGVASEISIELNRPCSADQEFEAGRYQRELTGISAGHLRQEATTVLAKVLQWIPQSMGITRIDQLREFGENANDAMRAITARRADRASCANYIRNRAELVGAIGDRAWSDVLSRMNNNGVDTREMSRDSMRDGCRTLAGRFADLTLPADDDDKPTRDILNKRSVKMLLPHQHSSEFRDIYNCAQFLRVVAAVGQNESCNSTINEMGQFARASILLESESALNAEIERRRNSANEIHRQAIERINNRCSSGPTLGISSWETQFRLCARSYEGARQTEARSLCFNINAIELVQLNSITSQSVLRRAQVETLAEFLRRGRAAQHCPDVGPTPPSIEQNLDIIPFRFNPRERPPQRHGSGVHSAR